jgi:peptidoglycan/LPS O-acetylase OafA/YrhL
MTAEPKRNPNLDALRGIAILMVVGHHLGYFSLWTRIGWAGVDLFFVLSGYLVSGLLFTEWQRTRSIDFRTFFIRRGFKIYPSFYALLLVTVAANGIRPGISSYPVTFRSILSEATFTQNYLPGIWGQTWSLAVEEHFYVLLPLLLLLMCRIGRNREDPFRSLPRLFFTVAAAEIVLRILVSRILTSDAQYAAYLCPTHLRLDALFFGVLIRYYRQFQPARFFEMTRGAGAAIIVVAAALLLVIVPRANFVMHTVGFTCVYFGAGFLLARVVDLRPNRYIAAALVRPLAFIGVYSYSIYLWHGWIARLLPHSTALSFVGCLLASIALGIVMAKIIEYPLLGLRDRLVPARQVQPIPAPLVI